MDEDVERFIEEHGEIAKINLEIELCQKLAIGTGVSYSSLLEVDADTLRAALFTLYAFYSGDIVDWPDEGSLLIGWPASSEPPD